jgi:transposase
MHKDERGHRLRGSGHPPSRKAFMRFVGIDIASEEHMVSIVDGESAVVVKPTAFTEDAAGYEKLLGVLGKPEECLIAMEATGHYWQNLFAVLAAQGYGVALLNPLRTRRFAEGDLERTKTDAIDALGIARFTAQKRPPATRLPEVATQELRELVRLRDRLVQDLGDRVRQLHRIVDLGFPELTRHVHTLDSELATAILREYPTAAAFVSASPHRLAKLKYDGVHKVGRPLADALITAAKVSVGQHHAEAYRVQARYACEDIDVLRRRIRQVSGDIQRSLDTHEVGTLLTTIDGIGPLTAARIVAELGNPADFRDGAALASYVGVVPALKHSGKHTPARAGLTPVGHAQLRAKLWMPTLTAVRKNPWLRAYYQRLRKAGKLPKVALIAAMRKLLHAIYSVAKNRRPFVPQLREATS